MDRDGEKIDAEDMKRKSESVCVYMIEWKDNINPNTH